MIRPDDPQYKMAMAALGWQLRARRLERENAVLRRRPTWPAFLVALFSALFFFSIALTLAVTQ